MTEDKDERSQRINSEFERHLPQIWAKARENKVKMKLEYLGKLQTKLLEFIRSQIPKDQFDLCFNEVLDIVDITESNQVIFSVDTRLNAAWLQFRYNDMLKTALKSITNNKEDIELLFVVRKDASPQSLEGESFKELYAMAKKELKEHKESLQKGMLKPDNKEGLLDISECVMCGCTDIPNKNLELPVSIGGIVSITVMGAQCTQCGESYYDSDDIEAIGELRELTKRKKCTDRINPQHLQTEDYQRASAKVANDVDEEDE